MRRGRWVLSPLALLLMASCVGNKKPKTPTPTPPTSAPSSPDPAGATGTLSTPGGTPAGSADAKGGTPLGPSGAVPAGTGKAPPPLGPALPAGGTVLTPADTKKVLDRLSPLKTEPGDETDFSMREKSLPPPKTGKVVQDPFPPAGGGPAPKPPEVERGPLTVLRYSPEGDPAIVSDVSVTFSQAMVAITSVEELAQGPVPVKITPAVPGQWRWLGTQTLTFKPDAEKAFGRFPAATAYTVEVAAGTKSAAGNPLDKPLKFTFATPPPSLQGSYPYNGQVTNLEPLMVAIFDQKIDPAAVLAVTTVTAGSKSVPVRLATEEEIKADSSAFYSIQSAQPGRYLVFRAKEKLPQDTRINVKIGPGIPSAEGPRKADTPATFSFQTYGPFKLVRGECGYDRECPPGATWYLSFTNPIDTTKFKKELLTIEPALPKETSIYASGESIWISGQSKGRTTYKISVDPSLADSFGQSLDKKSSATIKVGNAPKSLYAPSQGFLVADPSGGSTFSVYTVNYKELNVRVYQTSYTDWAQYLSFVSDYYNTRKLTPPGKEVFNKSVKVSFKEDEQVETKLDLASALTNGKGNALVVIEAPGIYLNAYERPRVYAWVQFSSLAADALVDAQELTAIVTDLKDGKPVEGAEVSLYPGSKDVQKTSKDGLAALPLGSAHDMLLVKKGNDLTFLPANTYNPSGWSARTYTDELRWYVFDDRKLYRPGEEVHLKGWIRRIGNNENGDVGKLPAAVKEVSYTASDSRGNELAKGKAKLSPLGGFDLVIKLPKTANLGYTYVNFSAEGLPSDIYNGATSHYFQIEEFRRPEYEVKAEVAQGPFFFGDKTTLGVLASYFSGGALPNADVVWSVSKQYASFTPPNRDEYNFGQFTPWWEYRGGYYGGYDYYGYGGFDYQSAVGKTDAAGRHTLEVDLKAIDPARPYTVMANASVTDVNRQTFAANASFLVHPSSLYVGLKSDRYFVQKGENLLVDAIVVGLDGKAVKGTPFTVTATRRYWSINDSGAWEQKSDAPSECKLSSAEDAQRCTFKTTDGGTYEIRAEVLDSKQRKNSSQMTLWVAGGEQPLERNIQQERVTIIPNKKSYKPGETAEILVLSPFEKAEGVLTLRRTGIVKAERFTLSNSSAVLKIKLEDAYTPNLDLSVDLTGQAPRLNAKGEVDTKLPARPAYAQGKLSLSLPPVERTLTVTPTPKEKTVNPGQETTLSVDVKDHKGKPVAGAEVAVIVVDESILSLTGYRLPDPLAIFYAARYSNVSEHFIRAFVALDDPAQLKPDNDRDGIIDGVDKIPAAEAEMAPGALGGASAAPPAPKPVTTSKESKAAADETSTGQNNATPITARADFNPLPLYVAAATSDASGKVTLKVKLPDSLTRYRVMAVAVEGERRFGSGEDAITARLPLMVRPSAPRFLNYGDKAELPVVLQNQTNAPMSVNVAVRSTNTSLQSGMGYRVTVPANDRLEVRFPMETKQPGVARFQVAAVSGAVVDAAEFSLPVYTPATTEAFATYGVLDSGAIGQPVAAPDNVVDTFGGLEVTTSSTALSSLTDAVLYLVAYPYECAEQVSSRVLAVAALKDVLGAFKAEGLPSPEEMQAAMERDIKKLQGMQSYDGGFGFWSTYSQTWPHLTVHVTHALSRAKEKGYTVPEEMLTRALGYLRDIESKYGKEYSKEVRASITSYSLYVRHRLGDADPAKARKIIRDLSLEKLPLEAVGWLLPVLESDKKGSASELEAIKKLLAARVSETAGAAHFTTSYQDGSYLLLASDRRTDGVLLEALIGSDPKSDLISKLVKGLLEHRKAGRWSSTQENAFVLVALDRYFNTYEKAEPDFVARAWLGDTYAGGNKFKGYSTDRHYLEVPMKTLRAGTPKKEFILSKEGTGRLYYRIGLSYAPTDLNLKAVDYGFRVSRSYEAVDHPDDVKQDKDGVWHVKAGARVRVKLNMVAQSRRYHVALVDPLPAGLEAENATLATTAAAPRDPAAEGFRADWWYYYPWYEHQNLRDERAEAFTSLLWQGAYNYSYIARATTPGSFIVPPAKAEEMYSPETFGRSSTDRLIVE